MSDIVERLRAWVYTDSQYATAREAADEIERLRNGAVERRETVRLTDAEREAVAYYLGTGGPYNVDRTLVALLQRLK
jgi:DNA-binding MarR family transcriptional regulator